MARRMVSATMGVILRFIQLAFGTVALAAGMLCALFAVIWWQQGQTGLCITFGLFALPLMVIGNRSLRGRRRRRSWRSEPATEKQKEFADELGIRYPRGITKGELSDLISRVTGK